MGGKTAAAMGLAVCVGLTIWLVGSPAGAALPVRPPLPPEVVEAAKAANGPPPADVDVRAAIEKGNQFLLAAQATNGSWAGGTPAAGDTTVIVTTALCRAGVRPFGGQMGKAITWMEDNRAAGSSPALHYLLWLELRRRLATGDMKSRFAEVIRNVREGAYEKLPGGEWPGEHTWTVLALHSAHAAHVIPPDIWKDVAEYWMRRQGAAGECSREEYSPRLLSDTATGAVAIARWDQLGDPDRFVAVGKNMGGQRRRPPLAFMDAVFSAWHHDNDGLDLPTTAYLIQQACLATGQWRLGGREVWPTITAVLLKLQRADGSWPGPSPLISTARAVDFLAATRLPLVAGRLQYDGDWNNRPLAMPNMAGWISMNACNMPMAWRVVDARSLPLADPAPDVLVVTGSKAPKFTPDDLAALRTYVQRGGMIFSCAEGKGEGFGKGIRQAYRELFGDFDQASCPEDHPVYRQLWGTRRLPLQAISNGPRLLAVHCDEDMPLHWQKNDWQGDGRPAFEAAYSAWVAQSQIRWSAPLLRWPAETKFTPKATVALVRVRHAGRWDLEPLACTRFARLMAARHQVQVDLPPAVTADKLPGRGPALAMLSGTGPLRLNPGERAGLKAFVAGGGTLLVEAVGGDETFASSARALLSELYGGDALQPLALDAPLYRMKDYPIEHIGATNTWQRRYRMREPGPVLAAVTLAGRQAVFSSPADITAALLGRDFTLSTGYRPESAFELLRNLLLHSAAGQK